MFARYVFFEQMASDLLDAYIKKQSLKPILEKYIKKDNYLIENFDKIIDNAAEKIRNALQNIISIFPPAKNYKEIVVRLAKILKKSYAKRLQEEESFWSNLRDKHIITPEMQKKRPWHPIDTPRKQPNTNSDTAPKPDTAPAKDTPPATKQADTDNDDRDFDTPLGYDTPIGYNKKQAAAELKLTVAEFDKLLEKHNFDFKNETHFLDFELDQVREKMKNGAESINDDDDDDETSTSLDRDSYYDYIYDERINDVATTTGWDRKYIQKLIDERKLPNPKNFLDNQWKEVILKFYRDNKIKYENFDYYNKSKINNYFYSKNIRTFKNFIVNEEKSNKKFNRIFHEVIRSKLSTDSKIKILFNNFFVETNMSQDERYNKAFGMQSKYMPMLIQNILKKFLTEIEKEAQKVDVNEPNNKYFDTIVNNIKANINQMISQAQNATNSEKLIKKLIKPDQIIHKDDKKKGIIDSLLGKETQYEKQSRYNFLKDLRDYAKIVGIDTNNIKKVSINTLNDLQNKLQEKYKENPTAINSLLQWKKTNEKYFTPNGIKKLAASIQSDYRGWLGSNLNKVIGSPTAIITALVLLGGALAGGNQIYKANYIKSGLNDAKAIMTAVAQDTTTPTPDDLVVKPDTSTPATGEAQPQQDTAQKNTAQKDTDQTKPADSEQSKKFTQDDIKNYYEKGAEFAKKTGEGFAQFVKTAENLKQQNDANKETQEKDDAKDVGEGLTKGDLKKMSFYEIEKKFKDNKDVLKNMIQQKIDAEGGFDWVAQDQTKLGNISNIQTDNDISIISAEKANELLKNPKFQGEYNQEKLKNIIKQATTKDLKKQNDASKENQEKDDAKDVGEGRGYKSDKLKMYLQDFAKLHIKKQDFRDERTGKIIATDIGIEKGYGFNEIGGHSSYSIVSKAYNVAKGEGKVTGADLCKAIEDIRDSLPDAYASGSDTKIYTLKDGIMLKLINNTDLKTVTPDQAKNIIKHVTNPEKIPQNLKPYDIEGVYNEIIKISQKN